VILRHGFRNALIPVITVIGLDTGSYLTGSILTETIFGWPGLGRYVLSAIEKRDSSRDSREHPVHVPGIPPCEPRDGPGLCES